MVGFGVEDVSGESYRFVVEEFVVNLGAVVAREQGARDEDVVDHFAAAVVDQREACGFPTTATLHGLILARRLTHHKRTSPERSEHDKMRAFAKEQRPGDLPQATNSPKAHSCASAERLGLGPEAAFFQIEYWSDLNPLAFSTHAGQAARTTRVKSCFVMSPRIAGRSTTNSDDAVVIVRR